MVVACVKRDWNVEARVLLKREMEAAGVGYAELSEALLLQGLCLSPKVLSNKVNRGTFTMAFFLQCMAILKVNEVRLRQ
jgi:DNA (cytosine-5)-methyltransferase 1